MDGGSPCGPSQSEWDMRTSRNITYTGTNAFSSAACLLTQAALLGQPACKPLLYQLPSASFTLPKMLKRSYLGKQKVISAPSQKKQRTCYFSFQHKKLEVNPKKRRHGIEISRQNLNEHFFNLILLNVFEQPQLGYHKYFLLHSSHSNCWTWVLLAISQQPNPHSTCLCTLVFDRVSTVPTQIAFCEYHAKGAASQLQNKICKSIRCNAESGHVLRIRLNNVPGMEYSPIISVLSKLQQKDHKFKTSLGNRISLNVQ